MSRQLVDHALSWVAFAGIASGILAFAVLAHVAVIRAVSPPASCGGCGCCHCADGGPVAAPKSCPTVLTEEPPK